jgi:hypothetical protein
MTAVKEQLDTFIQLDFVLFRKVCCSCTRLRHAGSGLLLDLSGDLSAFLMLLTSGGERAR